MSATISGTRAWSGQRTMFAPFGKLLNLLEGDEGRVLDVRHDVANLLHVRDDAPAEGLGDELLRDDARRDPRGRLSSARAATAAVVAKPVLRVEGVVGMPGRYFSLTS